MIFTEKCTSFNIKDSTFSLYKKGLFRAQQNKRLKFNLFLQQYIFNPQHCLLSSLRPTAAILPVLVTALWICPSIVRCIHSLLFCVLIVMSSSHSAVHRAPAETKYHSNTPQQQRGRTRKTHLMLLDYLLYLPSENHTGLF